MINIVVAFPKIEDATSIKNLLVRNGYPVSAVCTSGTKVLSALDDFDYGIVVCGYRLSDMLCSELRYNMSPNVEMILMASPARLSDVNGEGIISVAMPLKTYDLVNTLEMVYTNITRKRKKQRQQPKKRAPEEQAVIDSAKKILIEKNNLTEEEAYRYIQKSSMDSGTNMVETAQMVISIMTSV